MDEDIPVKKALKYATEPFKKINRKAENNMAINNQIRFRKI